MARTTNKEGEGVLGPTLTFGKKIKLFDFASIFDPDESFKECKNTIKLLKRVLPYLGFSKIGCQTDTVHKQ